MAAAARDAGDGHGRARLVPVRIGRLTVLLVSLAVLALAVRPGGQGGRRVALLALMSGRACRGRQVERQRRQVGGFRGLGPEGGIHRGRNGHVGQRVGLRSHAACTERDAGSALSCWSRPEGLWTRSRWGGECRAAARAQRGAGLSRALSARGGTSPSRIVPHRALMALMASPPPSLQTSLLARAPALPDASLSLRRSRLAPSWARSGRCTAPRGARSVAISHAKAGKPPRPADRASLGRQRDGHAHLFRPESGRRDWHRLPS
jgi:hypothetical protein